MNEDITNWTQTPGRNVPDDPRLLLLTWHESDREPEDHYDGTVTWRRAAHIVAAEPGQTGVVVS